MRLFGRISTANALAVAVLLALNQSYALGEQGNQSSGKPASEEKEQGEKKRANPGEAVKGSKRKPPAPNVDPTATNAAILRAEQKAREVTADFAVSTVDTTAKIYSVTLSDKTRHTSISTMFGLEQLKLFDAIMSDSQKFALTEEAVGKTKPIITRFYLDDLPSFFVDVSKMGNRSQYFVTVKSAESQITIDAGTIKRGEPSAGVFFDTMLARIRDAIAAATLN